MSWLDQLQQASFRGVPFHVDTIDVAAGDTVVVREYPFQDLPTVFRMGEGAEEIKFSAYVIGPDYNEQRDRLREVLTGDGVLVHPTAGAIRAFVAGRYTIKEAPTAEGGMARFDLTFIRAETRRYPRGVASPQAESKAAAQAAKKAAADDFASRWSIAGKPGWIADQAVSRLRDSVSGVWSQVSAVTQGLNEFTSEITGAYQTLADGLDDLVRTPRLLADSVVTLFALPADLENAAARKLQNAFSWAFTLSSRLDRKPFEVTRSAAPGVLAMYGTGKAEAGPAGSVGQTQARELAATTDRLIQSLAIASYIEASAAAELASYDDAMAMRNEVQTQMTSLLVAASAAAAPTELPTMHWQAAMQRMHAAALGDLAARSRDLVRLTTYTPETWQPVWYVSYKLYGTAAYADEIQAMNPHIRHPMLVPPGRPLRIVRHD